MRSPSDSSEFRRLGRAVEAWLRFQADGASDPATFLAANSELSDLLAPMVAQEEDPTAAEPLLDGRFLAGFRLVREIGRGGMGVVYEAEELALGRRVALKVLPAQFGITPRHVERFRREAAAAARLRHPGIVPVYQVGEVDGTHYFAMELIDGQSVGHALADLRARCGDDPVALLGEGFAGQPGSYFATVAGIVEQAADAIAAAHEGGILHRDLKPHNLLLAPDGKVRVVDFGLAKELERKGVSRTGDLAGTPHYMSPEQALGSKTIDERTDVYSLGVVLYELLTLRPPFDAETPQGILHLIATREPDSPRRGNPRVPRELETICLRAMEKDPRHRYQSAAALAADLRRFVRHEPIEAKPAGSVTRLVKLLRRRRAHAVAGALGFLLIVVGPLAFALYQRAVNAEIAQEQRETARQRDLARGNYVRARRFVEQQLDRVDQLAREPGMELVQRQMAEDALRCYREIEAAEGAEPELTAAALQTAVLVGRIHHHLGAHADARAALDGAIARAGAADSSADPDVLLAIAEAHRHRSAVLRAVGALEAATADVTTARGAIERVRARETDEATARRADVELAALLFDTARQASEDGRDSVQAGQLLSQAADLLRAGTRTMPQAVLLADVLRQHCEVQRTMHQAPLGRPSLEAAQRELTTVDAADAHDPMVRIARAQVEAELGALHRDLGDLGAAETALRGAVNLREELARDYPRNQGHRHGLEVCLTELCAVLGTRGSAEWRPVAERAEQLALALYEEAKDNVLFATRLCVTSNQRCRMRADMRSDAESVEDVHAAFERCIALHRQIATRFPDIPRLRSHVGAIANNYARFSGGQNRWQEAQRLVVEAIEHQDAAVAGDPSVWQYQRFRSNHYMLLTQIEIELGRLPEAAAAARSFVAQSTADATYTAFGAKLLTRIASAWRAGTAVDKDVRADELEASALTALRAAFDLDSRKALRDRVAGDSGYAPLRRHAAFQDLLGTPRR